MKINHPDWYPSYLNPSFEELLELAQSSWDTCRILVNNDNDDFVIASGLGNTHSSILDCYRLHLGGVRRESDNRVIMRNHPSVDSFILFHSQGIAFMNLEDVSGSQYSRYEQWPFLESHLDIIKDLIRESNLSL